MTMKDLVWNEYGDEIMEKMAKIAKRMLGKGMQLDEVLELLDVDQEELEQALAKLEE